MAKNKTGSVITAIVYLLIFIFVIALIGFVFKFTEGFTSDFKTFYVEYEGEDILSDTNKVFFVDKDLRFDVKYTLGNSDSDESTKYTVSVIANKTDETDFAFSVDGEQCYFSEEKSFTKYFDITLYDDYFILKLPPDMTMQSILEELYPGKTVEVPETVDLYDKYYFTLLVTSYDGKSDIAISFKLPSFSIKLNPSHIVF